MTTSPATEIKQHDTVPGPRSPCSVSPWVIGVINGSSSKEGDDQFVLLASVDGEMAPA